MKADSIRQQAQTEDLNSAPSFSLCPLWFLFLAFLASLSGCAMGTHIVDVSNDPRFQGGFRVGQVFKLKTTGYLVQPISGGDWELWTPAELAHEPSSTAQFVPAGSTVRIDRLGYLYDDYHPPIAGGQLEVLLAYGTVTIPDGIVLPKTVVVLPLLRDARTISGTSVQVYPADANFLELVAPP